MGCGDRAIPSSVVALSLALLTACASSRAVPNNDGPVAGASAGTPGSAVPTTSSNEPSSGNAPDADDVDVAPASASATGGPSDDQAGMPPADDVDVPMDVPTDVPTDVDPGESCLKTAPPVPRAGEQCWEFRVHGESSPTDTGVFELNPGESYNEWYFAIPWPEDSVATRIYTEVDNAEVAYFQTTFSSEAPQQPGDVRANVTGTTLFTGARVLAMAGAGGCRFELPDDVGLELPDTGLIMVQWHMLNSTTEMQRDASAVHVCSVPAAAREHVAGIAVVGTENLGGGIGGFGPGRHVARGECRPTPDATATLVGVTPHLRRLGIHTSLGIAHQDGSETLLLDAPYSLDQQYFRRFSPRAVLAAGEALNSTCEFDNTTDGRITFGQSAYTELCYHTIVAYPVGAIENGAPSLIGALNTCL